MTYLSVKEAADIAKKNERTIRRWIKAGRLDYSEINGKYHVKKESLFERLKIREKKEKRTTEDADKNKKIKSDKIGQNMIKKMSADRHFRSEIVDKKRSYHVKENKSLHDNNEVRTKQTGGVIREGMEYELTLDKNILSGQDENNMSVNKYHKGLIQSDVADYSTVEMSKYNDFEMSKLSKYSSLLSNDDTNNVDMSIANGGLSTNSDTVVDNFFDKHNIINGNLYNEFSNLSGRFSDNKSGHINRTIELSAYATRLLDEKDNIIHRVDEQNRFLNDEIKALKTELNAIRVSIEGERTNHANLDQFLLDSNRHWQEVITANLKGRSDGLDKLVAEWGQIKLEWDRKQEGLTDLWRDEWYKWRDEFLENNSKKLPLSGQNINYQANKYVMFGLGMVLGGIALGLAVIMQFLLLNS